MVIERNGPLESLKHKVKTRLMGRLTERSSNPMEIPHEELEVQLDDILKGVAGEGRPPRLSAEQERRLKQEILEEMVGLGPLSELLADPTISEIMVNGPKDIFVERNGRLSRVEAEFRDLDHVRTVIERLLRPTGACLNESEPCVDASLPDGTRVNIVIPPLVLNGPTMTIRKTMRQLTLDDIIRFGSLTEQAAEFLGACVKAKANLVISGGTSTGKTTLVTILSAFIPPDERIITIENVAELLLLNREHWVRLVAKPPNLEGRGEIPLRTLVRNALRMRPDRLILGEARSGEAMDVVQAMHAGHDGVITILHASSPHAALERLQTLMLMSDVELPARACQMQIGNAVDLVIHLARYADGSRRVASIAHVLDSSSDDFHLEELFVLESRGSRPDGTLDGCLRYTGVRPKFLKKFQLSQVPIPTWIRQEVERS